jgi:hypothetical protein
MQESNSNQNNNSANDPVMDVFRSLPQKIRTAIVESHWEQKIRLIAQKHNLVIGDANILEKNTFLVMLGIISPRNYASELKKEIGLDDENLNSIINAVEDEIFIDIKQDLVMLEEKNFAESTKESLPETEGVLKGEEIITKENIAAEIIDHIEIISDDSTNKDYADNKNKKNDGFPSEEYVQKKLNSVVESAIENYVMSEETANTAKNDKNVDPYRESLEQK